MKTEAKFEPVFDEFGAKVPLLCRRNTRFYALLWRPAANGAKQPRRMPLASRSLSAALDELPAFVRRYCQPDGIAGRKLDDYFAAREKRATLRWAQAEFCFPPKRSRAPKPTRRGDVARFVYVMRAGATAFKIGISADCAKRLKEVATGCPWPVLLAGSFESAAPRDDEFSWHVRLSPYHSNLEWFVAPPRLVDRVCRLVARGYVPPRRRALLVAQRHASGVAK